MGCRFVLCEGCSRHVKTCDPLCPFCGSDTAGARPSSGQPYRRMAAAAAVAAGVAAVTGSCGGHKLASFYGGSGVEHPGDNTGSNGDDSGSNGDDASTVAFYGSFTPVPSLNDASPNDASSNDGSPNDVSGPDGSDASDAAPSGDGSAEG